MRREAALRLADMEALVAKTDGAGHIKAGACVTRWHQYIKHIDRDIMYRRQLIIDYHREWQSYRESAAPFYLQYMCSDEAPEPSPGADPT